MKIPVWEQLATDQTDPWQVVTRMVFTPYDCLLISVAFVFLCRVGCLGVTGVMQLCSLQTKVELQWLEHLRDHESVFEAGVV